jgi:hypothetical protein
MPTAFPSRLAQWRHGQLRIPTAARQLRRLTGFPDPGRGESTHVDTIACERMARRAHREFARQTELSRIVDPMPTFQKLSRATGVPVDTLVHHALVRWASAGSEALMAIEPQALRDLIDARRREDWATVAGIIDWLEAGL